LHSKKKIIAKSPRCQDAKFLRVSRIAAGDAEKNCESTLSVVFLGALLGIRGADTRGKGKSGVLAVKGPFLAD
jgi:hypothetical protein